MVGGVAPLVDCNVHLWDQTANPIFWLTDRTLVRDMLGNYDSLPDTYALADYAHEVAWARRTRHRVVGRRRPRSNRSCRVGPAPVR